MYVVLACRAGVVSLEAIEVLLPAVDSYQPLNAYGVVLTTLIVSVLDTDAPVAELRRVKPVKL